MISQINVLITSSSDKLPLINSVKKALEKTKVDFQLYLGEIDVNAPCFFFGFQTFRMPSTNSNDNVSQIITLCEENSINFIIPTRDQDLVFFSENIEVFNENSINVIVSPIETIKLCFDKLSFSQFGLANNLPFIPAYLCSDEVNAMPMIVKPRFGSGSNNVYRLTNNNNIDELSRCIEEPIFQPYIDGFEISVDAWIDNQNQLKGLVMRTRDYVKNGESKVTRTYHNNILEKKFITVFNKFKFRGHVVLQAIIDKNNIPYIIEINPRFGGASNLSIKVGLDSFYWSFMEVLGDDISKLKFNANFSQTSMIKYIDEKFC